MGVLLNSTPIFTFSTFYMIGNLSYLRVSYECIILIFWLLINICRTVNSKSNTYHYPHILINAPVNNITGNNNMSWNLSLAGNLFQLSSFGSPRWKCLTLQRIRCFHTIFREIHDFVQSCRYFDIVYPITYRILFCYAYIIFLRRGTFEDWRIHHCTDYPIS